MRIKIDQPMPRPDMHIDMARSVRWPRAVPIARERVHLPLSEPSGAIELQMLEHRVGTAFRIRLSRRHGKVTYWTRHKGRWSFDCRRVGRELTLIGFIEPNHPGYPVDRERPT